MGRSRTGIPLGERRAAATTREPPPLTTPQSYNGSGPTLGRHVWLVDAPGQPGRWPGLLVEWRRVDEGPWVARVVYAIPEPDRSGNRVVERWLPGDCLSPVLEA